jgi:16S rRNA (guanine966-N2)-methyltransferase
VRIVGGRWAGRDLISPGGRVRPTSEELRGRWVELLEDDLGGARVLELYAGTGAVGLEAISRGARSVDFVENDPAALHALKANVAALRLKGRARIFKRDALRYAFALPAGVYDVALADPPYGSRQSDRLVERWLAVPFAPILALEHAAEHRLPGRPERHRIGESALSFYRARRDPGPSATDPVSSGNRGT